MGGGSWSASTYTSYSTKCGRAVVDGIATTQNMFTKRTLDKALDPYKVKRECCDSEEHPNTIPVILALDVTGSMGSACKRVAQSLNIIMTDLYKEYKDIEFMMMAIGDLYCDHAPIQASQFESDIRIAEHTDKIYFERGGGGNSYESYTAAWYFGLNHCKLDCWNRGKKGIIITMGDEECNPYLQSVELNHFLGDNLQEDISTNKLYDEVLEKYNIYHISVDDEDTSYSRNHEDIDNSWSFLRDNYKISTLNQLPKVIGDCIKQSQGTNSSFYISTPTDSAIPTITW